MQKKGYYILKKPEGRDYLVGRFLDFGLAFVKCFGGTLRSFFNTSASGSLPVVCCWVLLMVMAVNN